jgi:uncharacterized coiled-coil DUF342 family protein
LPLHSVLIAKVEEKRAECQKKGWTLYTNRKGKEVKVREVLDKISGFIKTFRDTVDVVVQYDPGHAALPWAAVRFLLQV